MWVLRMERGRADGGGPRLLLGAWVPTWEVVACLDGEQQFASSAFYTRIEESWLNNIWAVRKCNPHKKYIGCFVQSKSTCCKLAFG
jgi:hypothetical protein